MSTNVAGNPEAPCYGIAAEFDTAGELFHAAEQMRDSGFTRFDVFSPFPIHGMDQAMGLKRSLLGKIIFVGGLIGFISAVAIQFVPSSFIFPLIVMGKPTNLFTVPAFFPIMFEFTVLISAFTAHVRNADDEWPPPLESPHVQLGEVQASQRGQVLLRGRKERSQIRRR